MSCCEQIHFFDSFFSNNALTLHIFLRKRNIVTLSNVSWCSHNIMQKQGVFCGCGYVVLYQQPNLAKLSCPTGVLPFHHLSGLISISFIHVLQNWFTKHLHHCPFIPIDKVNTLIFYLSMASPSTVMLMTLSTSSSDFQISAQICACFISSWMTEMPSCPHQKHEIWTCRHIYPLHRSPTPHNLLQTGL